MRKILVMFCLALFAFSGIAFSTDSMTYVPFVVEGSGDPVYYFGQGVVDVSVEWNRDVDAGVVTPVADARISIYPLDSDDLLASYTTRSNGRLFPPIFGVRPDQPIRIRVEKRGYRTKTIALYHPDQPGGGEYTYQNLEVKVPLRKIPTTNLGVINRSNMRVTPRMRRKPGYRFKR